MTKTPRLGTEARKLFRCSIDTNVPILSYQQVSLTRSTQSTEDVGKTNLIPMQFGPFLVFEAFVPLGLLIGVKTEGADAVTICPLQDEGRVLLLNSLVQCPTKEGIARRQQQGLTLLLLPAFAGGYLILIVVGSTNTMRTDGGINPLP